LLHVVSVTNFVASKISCLVVETSIPFSFVVPTFESNLKAFWLFPPRFLSATFEQERELGVKFRHVIHED